MTFTNNQMSPNCHEYGIHCTSAELMRMIKCAHISELKFSIITIRYKKLFECALKSLLHSRQITMPAPHRSVFYRPDALPAAQPTASKH